jgi:GxxExxY protein
MEHAGLTEKIIGSAMKVHNTLGPGFLESVYQKALAIELHHVGLAVALEHAVQVRHRGIVVGDFVVDMFVANAIVVETKAVHALSVAHEVQLVNYLAV